MNHELKTWPEFFEAMRLGKKKFEVRKNDKDFKVGDTLTLKEWKPDWNKYCDTTKIVAGEYTGQELKASVLYVFEDHTNSFGIQSGFVVMSIKVKK